MSDFEWKTTRIEFGPKPSKREWVQIEPGRLVMEGTPLSFVIEYDAKQEQPYCLIDHRGKKHRCYLLRYAKSEADRLLRDLEEMGLGQ